MELNRTLSRRELSVQAALLLLGGATITLSGCGGSDGGSSLPVDRSAAISANHGHAVTVTGAQLLTGGALSLSIQGTSEHNHTVELTASQITQIAAGTTVTVTSATGAGHTHDVTFN